MHNLFKAGTYTEREHQRSYKNYLTGSLSHLRLPTCDWRIQAHKEDNVRSDSSWWCVISRHFLSGDNNVKPAPGSLCMNSIYVSQGRWIQFCWRSWRIGTSQECRGNTMRSCLTRSRSLPHRTLNIRFLPCDIEREVHLDYRWLHWTRRAAVINDVRTVKNRE